MKYKEQFLFTTLIYFVFLLVLGMMGSTTYNNNNNNIYNNNNSNTIIITEDKEVKASLFDSDVQVNSIKEYNNNYIAYGSKDSYPYISILNDKHNEILKSFEYKNTTGNITNVNYNGIYLNTTIEEENNTKDVDLFISGNSIIPYHKKQLTFNYSKGVTINPKYLVIHETANTNTGADANAHYRYWSSNPTANASTHFVVDSTEIYQMLELNQMAWHVGDNKGYSDIKNTNSIGIEICVNKDGNYELARKHTIDLTIAIMNELNMSIDQLKIHRDASGKYDPVIMLNNGTWDDFVNQVNSGLNN